MFALASVFAVGIAEQPQVLQNSAASIAKMIVSHARNCFVEHDADEAAFLSCTHEFCAKECGAGASDCLNVCAEHAGPLYSRLLSSKASESEKQESEMSEGEGKAALIPKKDPMAGMNRVQLQARADEAANEQEDALKDLDKAQERLRTLGNRTAAHAKEEIRSGNATKGREALKKIGELSKVQAQIDQHLAKVASFKDMATSGSHMVALKPPAEKPISFLQRSVAGGSRDPPQVPEDRLAKEMTHDLEANFNMITPFGKEDTAKELQSHAAKTQDTLVDAVENAEVAEIKRAVFRALTRLRAATIKEFDTIARLETQAIDAYNDAHHFRAENPLAHLHEDEAPVETDKLKSFH